MAAPPVLLPHHRLLPTDCGSSPGPAPAGALHGLYILQVICTAAPRALPGLHVEICTVWCPCTAGEQPAPLWASPEPLGTSSCLEHILPSFCSDLGGCRAVSPTFSYSSLPAAAVKQFFFYPFLNLLSQRHPALLMAQLWPEIGPLGAVGVGSDLARGSAGLCSQKTFLPHPSFPPLKPCPISPVAPNH